MGRGSGSDAQIAANEQQSETLDEFMLRMADVKAPNSIKRIAWATGKPIEQVEDELSRLKVKREAMREYFA